MRTTSSDAIASAVAATLGAHPDPDADQLTALATRGRGLLAHGVGRLTIHTLGRRLGITDEASAWGILCDVVMGERL